MIETPLIMQVKQREPRRRGQWGIMVCIAAGILSVVLVLLLADRGLFTRKAYGTIVTIPGITLDDDDDDGNSTQGLPIVTSLRSNSEAERLGIRVGDHIDAVDGHPVRNLASLRAAMTANPAAGPMALHIRRGSAVWNIAIDRAEPAGKQAGSDAGHGAQDPAN